MSNPQGDYFNAEDLLFKVAQRKPDYRYALWDKTLKKPVVNPDTKKPFMFENLNQTFKFWDNRYGGSPNFCVWDLKKNKCETLLSKKY